jgi:hypothetical protein
MKFSMLQDKPIVLPYSEYAACSPKHFWLTLTLANIIQRSTYFKYANTLHDVGFQFGYRFVVENRLHEQRALEKYFLEQAPYTAKKEFHESKVKELAEKIFLLCVSYAEDRDFKPFAATEIIPRDHYGRNNARLVEYKATASYLATRAMYEFFLKDHNMLVDIDQLTQHLLMTELEKSVAHGMYWAASDWKSAEETARIANTTAREALNEAHQTLFLPSHASDSVMKSMEYSFTFEYDTEMRRSDIVVQVRKGYNEEDLPLQEKAEWVYMGKIFWNGGKLQKKAIETAFYDAL